MTEDEAIQTAKQLAGEYAADIITDGDVVGLGTGSTAAYAIDALGEAVDSGLDIVGVPTSEQARSRAIAVGIPVRSLDQVVGIDVAIDGADAVDMWTLIKGGGGAHAMEKVIDSAADRFIVVIDERKLQPPLNRPIPIEVLPRARPAVSRTLSGRGATVRVRSGTGKDGPVVTDNGNHILDVDLGAIEAPAERSNALGAIPGVVEHGLFVDMADDLVVGHADGQIDHRQR